MGELVKLYKVPLVINEPSDETEDKYMAEIPSWPGCRAWGDTPAEVLENLQSVASGFIDSYRSRGEALPTKVETALMEK
jgi:predicted RNase H-like HicB family nuclease